LYSCRTEVLLWFTSRLKALGSGSNLASKDAKTRLQEFLQAQRLDLPEYELSALTGKDHEQEFTVKCKISILDSAVTGRGTSRREAEQQAAAAALEKLNL
jgi:ribonuclease-3